MAGYRELLRSPGVARIITAQLVARVPQGMVSLSLLIHIERAHDSYGAAGLVLAAMSIGQAIAGPLTSRWMGSWGMRPVLILTSLVCAAALTVLALAPLEVPLQMIVALVGGLASPPVTSAVRTIYPKMVTANLLGPLFSLDSAVQELLWVGGPVVATFLATQVSSTVALLVCVGFVTLGGMWFIFSPEVGRVRIPRSRGGLGSVLTKPAVLIATLSGFLLIGACAAVEAGVVSVFGEEGVEAGVVLAIWAVSSLIGGLVFGRVPMSPWSLARRFLFMVVGCALAMVFFDFWWLTGALLVAGIGIAPALAVMMASVSSTVRFSETAEAYGWTGTGQLIGAAIGSAVAGFLIDGVGSIGAFAAATGLSVLGVVLAGVAARWMPDLRQGHRAPPETAPVPTTN